MIARLNINVAVIVSLVLFVVQLVLNAMLFFESRIDIISFITADIGQVYLAVAELLEQYEVFGVNNFRLGISAFWVIVVVNIILLILAFIGMVCALVELMKPCIK